MCTRAKPTICVFRIFRSSARDNSLTGTIPTQLATLTNMLMENVKRNQLLLLMTSHQTMEPVDGNTKVTPTMFKKILSQLAILMSMLRENAKQTVLLIPTMSQNAVAYHNIT